MPPNRYDQACRYAAKKLDVPGFLAWLLREPAAAVRFLQWLDTRTLPFPGEPDRTCDTVARLDDPAAPGEPWAVPVEFALEPEADLFGRLLAYLGLLWLEERPSAERGERYRVGAIVVNLTGRGHTSRDMGLGATGLRTCLQVVERDLASEDAAATLAGVAAGSIARCLLPFIPLMQGGAGPAIIQQWLGLASAEPDAKLRSDYGGLALVFAEAAGNGPIWRQALKGWNMKQSQQVLEWIAEGKVEGKAELLLRQVRLRFGAVPPELEAAIRTATDPDQLDRWGDAAVTAPTLDAFRQAAGL